MNLYRKNWYLVIDHQNPNQRKCYSRSKSEAKDYELRRVQAWLNKQKCQEIKPGECDVFLLIWCLKAVVIFPKFIMKFIMKIELQQVIQFKLSL